MTWSAATLGEIAERDGGLIQTGPFGSQLHQSDYVSDGIPVIMPKDITDGRVDAASVARVSEATANRLSRHQLRPRTIVLPRRGEITKRAFIRDDQAGWLCGTGCLQIALEGKHLLPEFLYYYMEQLGWDGKPRPQAQRRQVQKEWPETLEPLSDTYMDQVYQGPLG